MPSTIALGCTVGIVSSLCQSVGLTLQRQSHILEDHKPGTDSYRPPHRRARWRVGLLLFLIANVLGSSVQITTLPLVVLSPLQAVGLVFNSICATVILNEPFTVFSLVGTALVSLGALLIAAFGAIEEPNHSLNELLVLMKRKPFVLWMAFTAVLVFGIMGAIKAVSRSQKHLGSKRRASIGSGYSTITEEDQNETRDSPTTVLIGLLYGGISGILSAHSLLFAKSGVELLLRAMTSGLGDLQRWQSWAIVVCFLTLAVTQLMFLNKGLRLCSTSILYPLVFCVYNIITIVNGLVYFQQLERLSSVQIILVILGALLVFAGVVALSWRFQEKSSLSHVYEDEEIEPLMPAALIALENTMEEAENESERDTSPSPLYSQNTNNNSGRRKRWSLSISTTPNNASSASIAGPPSPSPLRLHRRSMSSLSYLPQSPSNRRKISVQQQTLMKELGL
ncbi:hypothetical protein B0I72DRAFT_139338 [Yarrowia lipolytica]|jgi:multidrug transporter EmrE-like cation transporter|uniref:YALI0D09317p n=2 Tax=Yarrowia lipolytica TaxID=4952 RepID=Q6C9P8_YARLI|nr:YALI0D09317p [Yarrowia lipolytica CLIB122]AOW03824.1 hypothetical protein YALI1_D11844g [Yarrowia lipolytica]KAB8283112.1 hypothetical protein BKA91DRAFT_137513 [Yarrowia lipolytica]KAE8170019.1 hypothetical protein BKA90DRAFT_141642 [Yarrowia lipolytica]KAJ8054594.1 hypothetical protein LXG23DRAFT_22077 [Yarrowia lipolytica]QNP97740.1 Putative magnesium transporter NIPA4 [Yarrowia lipolytica]|eukprot:XP_502614.1 YALI0D09317p [Yarrowia lipolytica CLIB122]